jgi:uncharacterized protein (DUF4415 family)
MLTNRARNQIPMCPVLAHPTLKNQTLTADVAPAIDWAAVDAAPKANMPDDDRPALIRGQALQLRPPRDVLPDVSIGKTRITINLDDAVLQAYKAHAGGRGKQTLINETLRDALRKAQLFDVLRAWVHEELHRQA